MESFIQQMIILLVNLVARISQYFLFSALFQSCSVSINVQCSSNNNTHFLDGVYILL